MKHFQGLIESAVDFMNSEHTQDWDLSRMEAKLDSLSKMLAQDAFVRLLPHLKAWAISQGEGVVSLLRLLHG